MTAELVVDREKIRSMVEDFWRSFLVTAQANPETSTASISKFDDQISALASMMPAEQSEAFCRAVEEERDALFQEYKNSPDALKTRLGLLSPPPQGGEAINASDHEAIVNAARRDYADLRVIAREKGSIRELGAKIDNELALRMRSYVANMTMKESAEFTRVYNAEYNRLVRDRLTGGQGQSGCAVVIAAGIGMAGAVAYASHFFM
ncbi:hypothetical protein NX784_27445 [Massilia pinisoli]|uniref:Uncharacterized protein n=1 Tax=Massilia pinisoli TaxID=1772194 RepID=A0ABT1ZZJ1_9BURK|nr:hypothetical protein [Massilia pinisoli]MCS0585320.1 hypothetical protein [Massilia pinisoli]